MKLEAEAIEKGAKRAAIYGTLTGMDDGDLLDDATLYLHPDGSITLSMANGRIIKLVLNEDGHVEKREQKVSG